jgi:hypothetical protein
MKLPLPRPQLLLQALSPSYFLILASFAMLGSHTRVPIVKNRALQPRFMKDPWPATNHAFELGNQFSSPSAGKNLTANTLEILSQNHTAKLFTNSRSTETTL